MTTSERAKAPSDVRPAFAPPPMAARPTLTTAATTAREAGAAPRATVRVPRSDLDD